MPKRLKSAFFTTPAPCLSPPQSLQPLITWGKRLYHVLFNERYSSSWDSVVKHYAIRRSRLEFYLFPYCLSSLLCRSTQQTYIFLPPTQPSALHTEGRADKSRLSTCVTDGPIGCVAAFVSPWSRLHLRYIPNKLIALWLPLFCMYWFRSRL